MQRELLSFLDRYHEHQHTGHYQVLLEAPVVTPLTRHAQQADQRREEHRVVEREVELDVANVAGTSVGVEVACVAATKYETLPPLSVEYVPCNNPTSRRSAVPVGHQYPVDHCVIAQYICRKVDLEGAPPPPPGLP